MEKRSMTSTANKYLEQLERLMLEFAPDDPKRAMLLEFSEWLKMWKIPIVEFEEFWDMRAAVRLHNSLRRGGIITLQDLTSRTRQQLLAIPNVGMKSIIDIQEFLQRFGLSLAMETARDDRLDYDFRSFSENAYKWSLIH